MGKDEMKEVRRQIGLSIRSDRPDDAIIIMPASRNEIPAPLGRFFADFRTECVVAGIAQPGDIFAAAAAPVEHVHLAPGQAQALPRQFEITQDFGIGGEMGELCFTQRIVVAQSNPPRTARSSQHATHIDACFDNNAG